MRTTRSRAFAHRLVVCWGVAGGCLSALPYVAAETRSSTIPWNLEALSEAPEFTWGADAPIRPLYYQGEPYQGRPTRVFAYYATPGMLSGDLSMDRNLPAMVLVHGGGGTAFEKWVKLWASRGYAAIAMDLAGCGPNKVRLKDGGPGQGDNVKFGAVDLPATEQWTYHAVANVMRAHSLIRSFPEVDADRTAITGISWGGYLTCIVAGLDHRFRAAVPVYGCGFLHENSVWLKQFEKMSEEHRAQWIRHWDPSRYVGDATMPMLFVNGGKDFAYPPDSHAKTYALVESPKNLHFVPNLRHGHIFDRPPAIEAFIQHHLGTGAPLPRIVSVHTPQDRVVATVETATQLVRAELYYTVTPLSGPAKSREWIAQPATIEQHTLHTDAPPEQATAWFVTVTDERGLLVSSPLHFPEGGGDPDTSKK